VELSREVSHYTLDVTLDVEQRQISGTQQVTYRNISAEPMPDLVFHLYMNAFEDEESLFLRSSGPLHRGFRWDEDNPGWVRVSELRLADGTALELELIEDGTLARAVLPQPVEPGASVTFDLRFTTQLPYVFARTGWALDGQGDPFFMVGQWFPKLGVWTDDGWNAYPYHSNSEYFANFGSYTTRITLPQEYIAGATGTPQGCAAAGRGRAAHLHLPGHGCDRLRLDRLAQLPNCCPAGGRNGTGLSLSARACLDGGARAVCRRGCRHQFR
jgi:hypothetical protein